MGYWQGIAQAIKEEDEQRFQREEARSEREWATMEKQKDRAASRDDFMFKLNLERQQTLLELAAKRAAEQSASSPEDVQNLVWLQGFTANTKGADEILKQAMIDPSLATTIRKQYYEIDGSLKEKDQPGWGAQDLVDNINVYGRLEPGEALDFSNLLTELEGADLNDPQTFYEQQKRVLNSGRPSGAATIDVETPRIPDTARYEKQVAVFDDQIVQEAIMELENMDIESQAARDIQNDLNNFDGSVTSKNNLRRRYGPAILPELLGNPLFSNWQDNPVLKPFGQ